MNPNEADGAAGYSPADVAFVLETDDPLLLVGGQAVNVFTKRLPRILPAG